MKYLLPHFDYDEDHLWGLLSILEPSKSDTESKSTNEGYDKELTKYYKLRNKQLKYLFKVYGEKNYIDENEIYGWEVEKTKIIY